MEKSNEVKNIEIDQEDLKHLNKTRKWSMFIAIIGFIFLGLVIAIGGIAGTFLTVFNSGDQGLSVPLLLTIVLIVLLFCTCFFPECFFCGSQNISERPLIIMIKKNFPLHSGTLNTFLCIWEWLL